jgi:amino acid permease
MTDSSARSYGTGVVDGRNSASTASLAYASLEDAAVASSRVFFARSGATPSGSDAHRADSGIDAEPAAVADEDGGDARGGGSGLAALCAVHDDPVARSAAARIVHVACFSVLVMPLAMHDGSIGLTVVLLLLAAVAGMLSDYILVVAAEHTRQFSIPALVTWCLLGAPHAVLEGGSAHFEDDDLAPTHGDSASSSAAVASSTTGGAAPPSTLSSQSTAASSGAVLSIVAPPPSRATSVAETRHLDRTAARALEREYRDAVQAVAVSRTMTFVAMDLIALVGSVGTVVALTKQATQCMARVAGAMQLPAAWHDPEQPTWPILFGIVIFLVACRRIPFEGGASQWLRVGLVLCIALAILVRVAIMAPDSNGVRAWVDRHTPAASPLRSLGLVLACVSWGTVVPADYQRAEPRNPARTMRASWLAAAVVTVLYVVVGSCAYVAFGDAVSPAGARGGNVLENFAATDGAAIFARVGVIAFVAAAMPSMIIGARETCHRLILVAAGASSGARDVTTVFKTSRIAIVVEALSLTVLVVGVTCAVPGAGAVLVIVGAVSSSVVTLVVPGIVGFSVFSEVDGSLAQEQSTSASAAAVGTHTSLASDATTRFAGSALLSRTANSLMGFCDWRPRASEMLVVSLVLLAAGCIVAVSSTIAAFL